MKLQKVKYYFTEMTRKENTILIDSMIKNSAHNNKSTTVFKFNDGLYSRVISISKTKKLVNIDFLVLNKNTNEEGECIEYREYLTLE